MSSNAASAAMLAWAAVGAACGGLADGEYRGTPLAVLHGTLTTASPVQPVDLSFALLWAPAADHESPLNRGGPPGSARDGSYTEACSDVVPLRDRLCDGTPAQGSKRCVWTDDRVASLLRVVDAREHITGQFEIPLRDLPPEAARYDLSRQGGTGYFALASVVVFDDRNRDGAFGLGTPENPPEPTLAHSRNQGYLPEPGHPRRSYLVAYLDGLVAPERIDPAFAEVLLFLPQGLSLWVEEEWLDGTGRTSATRRFWQPIDVSAELVMPTQAVAGCQKGTREIIYLSAIPNGTAPTWCSNDHFQADWSRTTASPTNGCLTIEERYSGDFACANAPPPAWACPAPTTGALIVSATTSGYDLDGDGYLVRVDGGAPQVVERYGSIFLPVVTPGTHEVVIDGLAGNCAVAGASTVQVSVAAGETAPVAFGVVCGGPGGIRVYVQTSGQSRDPDGYAVSLDGDAAHTVPVGEAGPALFSPVLPGPHSLWLSGLAGNCTAHQGNPLQVNLLPDRTLDVFLQVGCALRLGDLRVAATTSGLDQDPDGYTVIVSGSSGAWQQPIAANGSVLFSGVALGDSWVWISGLAPNCSLSSPNPQPVPVVDGPTADVGFAVACVETGSIAVTTTATGADVDPDGFAVAWSGSGQGGTVTVPANGTTVITGLVAGAYQLTLGGVAPNCDGPRTATITVVAGASAAARFGVACEPFGSLLVTTTTTGVDLDPDGFGLTWSGGGQSGTAALPANGTTVVTGLVAGAYQLAVGGVAPNCDGTRTSTATVAWGATASVAVDITCAPDRALAFHSPNGDIFFIHSNGTGLQRLTVDPANDSEPAWSPDGTRIAFTSERDGNREIYVMGADGSAQTRLTNNAAADHSAAWSRDGARIAFVSERDGSAEIYVMNADGSGPVRLTNDASPSEYPAWSPDGARIAFARGGRIWVMGTDGAGASPITSPDAGLGQAHTKPAWSPDGTKIAFAYSGSYAAVIAVSNVDGTGESWLLWDDSGCSWPDDPDWSPDGRRLAFAITLYDCMGGGLLDTRIQTIRADGTDIVDIASGDQPAWRP